mgnify:CR=1 FL=1
MGSDYDPGSSRLTREHMVASPMFDRSINGTKTNRTVLNKPESPVMKGEIMLEAQSRANDQS